MKNNLQAEEPKDIFDEHVYYIPASKGHRFLNLVIDVLVMRFIVSQATGYLLAYTLLAIAPDFLLELASENDGEESWRFWLMFIVQGYINCLIYYPLCEKVFRGYTLGKLITGTKAIREDGQELTFKDALLRTLSRMVPFYIVSGFGERPWHDSWTKTTVVKAR
jgi:uncharacterized RDD family membrane protein YckC